MRKIIQQDIKSSIDLYSKMLNDEHFLASIEKAADICVKAGKNRNTVFLAGNGGSAADAQHIAAELIARFGFDRPSLPALALTTDTSALTAIANDYEYEYIFARQLEGLGRKNDVFIGISTSGSSKNILRALDVAATNGMITIGFGSEKESPMALLCDCYIAIPSKITAKIQEGHITCGHILCKIIEEEVFAKEKQSSTTI